MGTSGIRENSICWINSTDASGNQPIKGYYMLKTFLDGVGHISQKAISYTSEVPLIKERIYCNGSWSDWTLPPASLNDLIPYAKTQDITDVLNVRQKLFYNDTNKSLLGITSDTTINQVVDGMMLPEYSELTLWINDDTVIGRTVRNDINETHKVNPFGYLTIKRFDRVIKLYFEDYGSTDVYLNSYTSINGLGWSADWVKK